MVENIFFCLLLFAGMLTLSQPSAIIPWSWLLPAESIWLFVLLWKSQRAGGQSSVFGKLHSPFWFDVGWSQAPWLNRGYRRSSSWGLYSPAALFVGGFWSQSLFLLPVSFCPAGGHSSVCLSPQGLRWQWLGWGWGRKRQSFSELPTNSLCHQLPGLSLWPRSASNWEHR